MYPTIHDFEGGAVTFKMHIPDIFKQFNEYTAGREKHLANRDCIGRLERQIRSGDKLFRKNFSAHLTHRQKADLGLYQTEFRELAINLNCLRLEFFFQVFLHQKTFQPERVEREQEIKTGLAFFEDLKDSDALFEYLCRILFAVPTGLLEANVISQVTLMIFQVGKYLIKDGLLDELKSDKKEKSSALKKLWGEKVTRLMMVLALQKVHKSKELKLIKTQLSSSPEHFTLFYENSSLSHVELFCALCTENLESVKSIFDSLNTELKRDVGRFKNLTTVDLYILTIQALRSLKEKPEGSHQAHIDNGTKAVWERKAHFTLLLFLGAKKLLNVPEIEGTVANAVREVVISYSALGVKFPESEMEELKEYLESSGYDKLKSLAAGHLGLVSEVPDDERKARKLLAHANEQIIALSEEDLDDLQKTIDLQSPPAGPKGTKSRKSKNKKKAKHRKKPASAQVPQPAVHVPTKQDNPMVDRYVAEALFSHSLAVLDREEKSVREIPPEGRTTEILQKIGECRETVAQLQRAEECKKTILKELDRDITVLEKECESLLNSVGQGAFPLTQDGQYERKLQEFCTAVETHIARSNLVQAYNRGDVLDTTAPTNMWHDIKGYFHGRQLSQYAALEFINPSRKLQANEKLTYYVTRSSQTAGIQFCISVHLWRLKDKVNIPALRLERDRLDERNWEDRDRGLGTSYYVLHIPSP